MAESDDMRPLYVRLPAATAQRLDRAAAERGASKRQLVTELLGQGLLRGGSSMEYGHAAVISGPTEILTLEEAAELLKVDAAALRQLAEAGQLPARRIGDDWRLSRSAILAWLGADEFHGGGPAGGPRGRGGASMGFAVGTAASTDRNPSDGSAR